MIWSIQDADGRGCLSEQLLEPSPFQIGFDRLDQVGFWPFSRLASASFRRNGSLAYAH
jgi:hypothetical protein